MSGSSAGAPAPGATDGDCWSARETTSGAIAAAVARLAEQRDGERRHARVPARALNLVIVVERTRREQLIGRLQRLGPRQPSRTIVCVVDEHRDGLDAWATMACDVPSQGGLSVCREWIEIDLARDRLGRLESILDPLLVSAVPTVVWAPGLPEAADGMLAEAQVLLTDSSEGGDPAAALARAGGLVDAAEVVDLAWLRTTPWRERLAAAFDPASERDALAATHTVTVRHEPGAAASALLLGGWLCSRLDWKGGICVEGAPTRERDVLPGAEGGVVLRLEPDATMTVPGLAGVTVAGAGGSLSLDRGSGGLVGRRRPEVGPERSWVALGASRGEPGILADALRGALTHDPAYRPALRAAVAMVA